LPPKRPITFILLLILIPQTILARQPSATQHIRTLLNQEKTLFSVHFAHAETGKTLFDYHADRPVVPASNMKIITAAAALDILGADFAYETVIALYQGNLAIFAGGDPLLGDPVLAQQNQTEITFIFDQVIAQLKKRNITNIPGDLIIDNFIFDDQRFHPSWPADQADKWWTAQVGALNFNNNCIDIKISPASQPGHLVRYELTPATTYVNITNQCKTTSKRKNTLGAARPIGTNNITLKGTGHSTHTIKTTVDRPGAFFGHVLAEHLINAGININGKLIIKQLRPDPAHLPDNIDILIVHRTAIADVLTSCNQYSLNLTAECLFKTLGAYYPSSGNAPAVRNVGSWENGRNAVNAFLKKLDIDPAQFEIDDGCGLSRKNRLSARTITTVLSYMHRRDTAELFRRSFATGATGTLKKRRRFAEPQYRNRIFAKTGYIAGARALSGYGQAKSGRWLTFAFLANKSYYRTTKLIDRIVKKMLDSN